MGVHHLAQLKIVNKAVSVGIMRRRADGDKFLLQVAERTAADKKGGHLCRRLSDGRFMLRESAMCPDDDKASFEDISKHKFFNTNNLWVNLPKLKVHPPGCMQATKFVLHSRCSGVTPLVVQVVCPGCQRGKESTLQHSAARISMDL